MSGFIAELKRRNVIRMAGLNLVGGNKALLDISPILGLNSVCV